MVHLHQKAIYHNQEFLDILKKEINSYKRHPWHTLARYVRYLNKQTINYDTPTWEKLYIIAENF